MTIARTTVVAAALTALWGAPPARAEDAAGAARRVAGSLAQQLKARPPRTPLSTVAVAPATEPAALQKDGLARLFAELLVPELARAAGVKVRDWKSVDAAAREQALKAAAAGGLDLPSVPEVQALLVTEASGAADGAVRLQVGAVEALPFPAASFDVVATTNTVYFWPDLPRAFAELHRVLAPGGRLTVGYSGAEKLRGYTGITSHGFHFHEDAALRAAAEGAGFREVTVTELDGPVTRGDRVLRGVR